MSASKTSSVAVGGSSNAAGRIWGAAIGRTMEWLIGACVLFWFLAGFVVAVVVWTERLRAMEVATLLTFSAGPVLILAVTTGIVRALRWRRRFSWLLSQGREEPPTEVEGWHVSAELGLVVVSLRSGVTIWIDGRPGVSAPLPGWLRGARQWGTVRFRGRSLPLGWKWVAPSISLIFMSAIGILISIHDFGLDYLIPLLLIFLGPIAALVGYCGLVIALSWHPSMELQDNVAKVLLCEDVDVSRLRVEVRGSTSGCGRVLLTVPAPAWPGPLGRRWFRPVAMFSRKERRAMGFNEAEALRCIIGERGRPTGSAYRVRSTSASP